MLLKLKVTTFLNVVEMHWTLIYFVFGVNKSHRQVVKLVIATLQSSVVKQFLVTVK